MEGRIKAVEKASQQNCESFLPEIQKQCKTSYCSTLTTSGTTYASSETDMESAVYVMGDEIDGIESLEMRLRKKAPGSPPTIAPLSESLLNVGRLSLTNSELSLSLNRSFEETQPRRCSSSSAVPIDYSLNTFTSSSSHQHGRTLSSVLSRYHSTEETTKKRSVAQWKLRLFENRAQIDVVSLRF
ncbi:hypothetical protein KIN20_024494 [Parelaphostrongylus tenuis]|uniref:Uncharacterized protein n=1 Tax=Parelaphostrongylus tenuis TaxID=148309 RepID=A0AAD5N7M8_PARTN|nr:hypothetical protein KIN20_024494 [Parelaphostrongylus tenuis]